MPSDEMYKLVKELMDLINKQSLGVDEVASLLDHEYRVIERLVQKMRLVRGRLENLEMAKEDSERLYKVVLWRLGLLGKISEQLEKQINTFGLTTEDRFAPYRRREIALKRKQNKFDYLAKKYPFTTEWKGEFPELSEKADIAKIVQIQFKMREIARKIIDNMNSSTTHLILSHFIRNEDLMMITATQTNKLALSPLSDIPFVRCIPEEKKVVFYGDREKSPSSETLTMWTIFKKTSSLINPACNILIHAHTPNLTVNYAWKHREFKIGKYRMPIVKWQHFGEPTLGEDIAYALTNTSTRGALLDDHGPFVISEDFDEGYELLNKLEELACKRTKGKAGKNA